MEQKPLILVVDSSKLALRYMESILLDAYDVALVERGEDALDFLKSEYPDLILMNANVSGMSGLEVLSHLQKEKSSIKEIPVILLMSEQDTESKLKGLEAGAIDFVPLPFEPPILLNRINYIVELTMLRRLFRPPWPA